jgi:hypothetical protein
MKVLHDLPISTMQSNLRRPVECSLKAHDSGGEHE